MLITIFKSNLIDVSQQPAILEEKDIEDRRTKYSQHIKFDPSSIKNSVAALAALSSVPTGTVLLSSDAPDTQGADLDRKLADLARSTISEALKQDQFPKELVADLVVTVDQLES